MLCSSCTEFGLNVYFGSGILNPEPAHLKDVWGASLRTGYAMERIRLATENKERWTVDEIQSLYDDILQDWQNNTKRTGNSHPNPWTLGRYGQARLSPFEKNVPNCHCMVAEKDSFILLQVSICRSH